MSKNLLAVVAMAVVVMTCSTWSQAADPNTPPFADTNPFADPNFSPTKPEEDPSTQHTPQFRVTLQMDKIQSVTEMVPKVIEGGKQVNTPVQKQVRSDLPALILDCDSISTVAATDDKGNISYSFTSTGPVTVTWQNVRIMAKDASLENGKLSLKDAIITSNAVTLRAADLLLDVHVDGFSMTRWTPTEANPPSLFEPVPTMSVPTARKKTGKQPAPDPYFPNT